MGCCEGLRLIRGGARAGCIRVAGRKSCRMSGGTERRELGRKGREGEAGGRRGRKEALSALDYQKKLRIEMRWSESRSAVAFRCETWWTKCASGVLVICAQEGKAVKWQCDMWGERRGARKGVGSRVGAWGQPAVYPGLIARLEASRLAVVWFPPGGAKHFCGQGGGLYCGLARGLVRGVEVL